MFELLEREQRTKRSLVLEKLLFIEKYFLRSLNVTGYLLSLSSRASGREDEDVCKASMLKTKLCAKCHCRERSCVQSVIRESEAVCKVSLSIEKLCAKCHYTVLRSMVLK